MKFDSFVKYAAGDGHILTARDDSKWLLFNNVAMMIPEHKSVCGTPAKMPEMLDKLIYDEAYDAADLINAYVPSPNSKPSELIRTFKGSDLSIDISNKHFGFIESKDQVYIGQYEGLDDVYTALLVTDDYNDDPDFKMVIIHKEDN